ncbi:cupin domain-containing protein [Oscillatoria sp. CS-180]|uniref:cupin domain-containing protein n=1 Tax=Oscillatoria sp. CS-180 TaxID=3021720 RepID=UPI00232B50DD|nr:cupin domain-containing protein [Oscillatoria sp. CS-180]MDB9525329.1 cupin domain-containing protein [Oscillatoria sp. CS-180]
MSHPLITTQDITTLPEHVFVHPLNSNAIRHTKSLSALTGCLHLGVHLVRITSGHDSTEHHRHRGEEEFLYIVSGRGVATIGDEQFEIQAGDFMGFAADGLAHSMHNPYQEDLVYLMGGLDLDYDVVEYPNQGKRLYRVGDRRVYEDIAP